MTTQCERFRALLEEAQDNLRRGSSLLDRIDAALAEPDEAEETEHQMHLRIRAGYDAAIADSWRAKVAEVERERDAARAEAEMLRGVGCSEDGDGPCGVCRKCAYQQGAERMRKAAMGAAWHSAAMGVHNKIRDLKIPEDKT